MLAAKEAHKRAMKKARSKWYELLMDDSNSDDDFELVNLKENLEDLEFSAKIHTKPRTRVISSSLRRVIPKSQKEMLKTTLLQKVSSINWNESEEYM